MLQPTRVMYLWPEAEGVCCIPRGMHEALQEDGAAGGCVGWSVVIYKLLAAPGERAAQSQGAKHKFSTWESKGIELKPCPF